MIDDEIPCDGLGDLRPAILFDQREREIDARGDAGRSPDFTVLDEDPISIDPNSWEAVLQGAGESPMRGRASLVEDARAS